MSKFIKLTFAGIFGGTVYAVNVNDVVMVQHAPGIDLDQLSWGYSSVPSDANAFIQIGRKHARGYFVTETVAEIYAMLGGVE